MQNEGQQFKAINQKEGKKHPADMLKGMLLAQSRETNKLVQKEYQLHDLLAGDATINGEGYRDLYGEEKLKIDKEEVYKCELKFSSAQVPGVQKFYSEQFGANNEADIIAKWKENKSREKNGQMEMAITILLSQELGKEFLVVRTDPYDDYVNGVDNLILNRTTGEVVGAFDEVHEGGRGERTEEKKKKIKKIAKNGGVRIHYGLELVDGKLKRTGLDDVPVFYLGLESSELVELIQGLSENNKQITDKIFQKLLESLSLQHTELEKIAEAPKLRSRLNSFNQSLSILIKKEELKQ